LRRIWKARDSTCVLDAVHALLLVHTHLQITIVGAEKLQRLHPKCAPHQAMKRATVFILGIGATILAASTTRAEDFSAVTCEGVYPGHLQGVCTDGSDAIFWSFSTQLVKTDRAGRRLKQVSVPFHHGDPC